jgi:uncharacterized protein YcbK (DUF882 family)
MGNLLQKQKLAQVDPKLAKTVEMAAKACPFDVLVVCGYRSYADQLKAYLTGKSKAKPGQSKHNKNPSQAVDLIAADMKGQPLWERLDLLYDLNDQMEKAAFKNGIKITWSKTWVRFVEFCHWELS